MRRAPWFAYGVDHFLVIDRIETNGGVEHAAHRTHRADVGTGIEAGKRRRTDRAPFRTTVRPLRQRPKTQRLITVKDGDPVGFSIDSTT